MICTRCKKEKPEELKTNGEPYKKCKDCRNKAVENIKKCPHNRQKNKCKDCGGVSICAHNRVKYQCKKCKGAGICQHNRRKSECKDCKGTSICEHNRTKNRCKDCKGSGICIHNNVKSSCKDCKGSSICIHNRHKASCKDCKGSSICIHNRQKASCKDCKGRSKVRCKECGGSAYCEHNRRKDICKECKGCEHNRLKARCIICTTPKNACTECKSVYVRKNSKYHPYCARCYAYTHPDEKLPRKYKLKENIFFEEIRKKYSELEMTIRFDRKIDGGCSGKRPDIFVDCLTHVVISELDENQHDKYDKTCENKRIMELFEDIGNRPIIVLRLNPDSYVDKDEEKHQSCFSYTKTGIIHVDKKEWEKRTKKFMKRFDYWLNHIPTKEVTIEKFFYSSK